MKNLIFLAVILIACILQVTIFSYVKAFRVSPDGLLICVILVSLYCEWKMALGMSFLSGIFKDSFGVNTVGIYTFLFPVICLITLKLSKKFTIDTLLYGTLFIFFITFVENVCVRVFLGFLGTSMGMGMSFRIVLLEPLYTAMVFPAVCKLLKPLLYRETIVTNRVRP